MRAALPRRDVSVTNSDDRAMKSASSTSSTQTIGGVRFRVWRLEADREVGIVGQRTIRTLVPHDDRVGAPGGSCPAGE